MLHDNVIFRAAAARKPPPANQNAKGVSRCVTLGETHRLDATAILGNASKRSMQT